MALDTKRECLKSLQEDEGVEWRNGRSGVAKYHGTDACYECSRSCHIGKHCAMVARVGLGKRRILVWICLPVKCAAIHNHATERCAMTADEFGSRMHHHISAVLDRTNKVGSAESVIDNEWNAVAVSHLSDSVEVGYIRIRVAEGLGIHRLGIWANCLFERFEVVDIHNRVANALSLERVSNQIERAAIEVVGSDNVVAVACDILQRIGCGSGTRSHSEGSHTTFEGCDALLKHRLGRIGETAIDISRVAKRETVGSVLRVAEHITCCLVDRHRACIGCRIGLLLSHMELECLKM